MYTFRPRLASPSRSYKGLFPDLLSIAESVCIKNEMEMFVKLTFDLKLLIEVIDLKSIFSLVYCMQQITGDMTEGI